MATASTRRPSAYVAEDASAEAAFARRLPELLALDERDLQQVNLEITSVVATVLGALPAIERIRPELSSRLPTFDLASLDGLEEYALALHHAHGVCLAASQPRRFRATLIEEARSLRVRMLTCLKACAASGFVDATCWARIRGTAGTRDLATDLSLLTSVFRSHAGLWTVQMLVTPDDIERSSRLATEILACAGKTQLSPQEVQRALEYRARAFTLVVWSYGRLREALRYLHLKERQDEIPSLYRGRAHSKRRVADSAGESAAQATPATADESNGGGEPWIAGAAQTPYAAAPPAAHGPAAPAPSEKTKSGVRIPGTGRRKRSNKAIRGPHRGAPEFRLGSFAPKGSREETPGLDAVQQATTSGEPHMETPNTDTTLIPGTAQETSGAAPLSAPPVAAAPSGTPVAATAGATASVTPDAIFTAPTTLMRRRCQALF